METYQDAAIVTHASEQSQLMHGQCYERERRAGEWQGWMVISRVIEARGANMADWPTCRVCMGHFTVNDKD